MGCGASSQPPQPLRQWLSYDAGRHSVTISLIPSSNGVLNGFNFNGYGKGQVDVVVPLGWTVTIRCRNAGRDGRHSCAVVSGPGSTTSAFPGASSPQPMTGIPPGASARFSFTASRRGVYRLASLVPGQERAGLWDVLEVRRTRVPAVVLLRRAP
jgi:hypothetical protein